MLVGYSGGADSTCLLHLLHLSGVDVVGAYLHHGQREEADDEQRRCQEFCESLDIPFVAGKADVPKIAESMGIGLEEAGREARYTFFKQAARASGCHLIATAHTKTDLAETVLLNLSRGTGLSGLSGIPQRRENIIRPLLAFSREQTKGYCEGLGLWTHDDPANSDLNFSRARIRHRVLPELRSINPRVESSIGKLAAIVSEEDEFLDAAAAAALEQAELKSENPLAFLSQDGEVILSSVRMAHLPPVLFRRGIRLATEVLGGQLDYHQTEAVVEGVRWSKPGSVTSEGGKVHVSWTAEEISLQSAQLPAPFRTVFQVPGDLFADDLGWQIVSSKEAPDGFEGNRRAGLTVALDLSALKGDLIARGMLPGDKLVPYGFDHHRKVSDLVAEAGISEWARRKLPVISDMLGPIWVPGVCLGTRGSELSNPQATIYLTFAEMEKA